MPSSRASCGSRSGSWRAATRSSQSGKTLDCLLALLRRKYLAPKTSAVLERQTPLTAPVGVHDVSFETPVAVADERDPPPVR